MQARIGLAALAALCAALALLVSACGGGSSDDGKRAQTAVEREEHGEWGEEDSPTGVPENEAEEHRLTRHQARLHGHRRARANRRSAHIAGSPRLGNAFPISGPSPLAGCPGLPGTTTDYEAEPHLAVNPRDPSNLIAAWQQDRSYAARGDVVSFSRDGGRSWRTVTVPGADTCQPQYGWLGVADAWLTFDHAGTAYVANLPGALFPGPRGPEVRAAVIVNRSRDGGETWSQPVTVAGTDGFNDKPMIAADPREDGQVYAVWERSGGTSCQGGGVCAPRILFSRSDDGAQNWSAPREIAAAPDGVAEHNARLLVLRDGGLRVIYEQGDFRETRHVMLVGSNDRGASWSRPRELVEQFNRFPTGEGLPPFYAIFEEAVSTDPRGRSMQLAWVEAGADAIGTPSTIWLRESDDGGASWTARQAVARLPALAMLPSVAADEAGRVAVSWYDFTADVPGDGKLTATYRLSVRGPGKGRGADAGRDWATHPLGSFDANACGLFSPPGLPGPKLRWIGEYFGLVPAQGAFATAFVGCGALSERGPEDILFARVRGG